jgi:hypothetical protein
MEAMRVTVVLLAQKSDFETHVLRQLAAGYIPALQYWTR